MIKFRFQTLKIHNVKIGGDLYAEKLLWSYNRLCFYKTSFKVQTYRHRFYILALIL